MKEREFEAQNNSPAQLMAAREMRKKWVKLPYLFLTFLKIGSYSFGGFMALVAVVRSELVEKAKVLTEDKLVEGISLASLLPGPTAVNVIAFTGNYLRGIKGAVVCMAGVLLPSFILIFILSVLYFRFNYLPLFGQLFSGLVPAVAAIILAVAVDLSKKSILDWKQALMAMIALGVSIVSKSYLATVIILLGSAVVASLITPKKRIGKKVDIARIKNEVTMSPILWVALVTALLLAVLSFLPYMVDLPRYLSIQRQITLTFSSMSLTAVGGGYIVIPAMQKLFVESLHWLSGREFSDAIAMGQITPGPIFISAAFIGYKVGGAWGALNATLSIFVPPAILLLMGARFLGFIGESVHVKAAFNGLRPAVVGTILSAVVFLLTQADLDWRGWLIFAISFIIPRFLKLEQIVIIIGSAIINFLLQEI